MLREGLRRQMTIWVYALLCVVCAAFWAYTRGVQEAMLFWGRRLGEGNEFLPSGGMQDAITPPGQNTATTVAPRSNGPLRETSRQRSRVSPRRW